GTHVLDPVVHGYLLLLSAATNSRVLRNQPQKPVWRLILHQSTMLDAEVPRTIVGRRAQGWSRATASLRLAQFGKVGIGVLVRRPRWADRAVGPQLLLAAAQLDAANLPGDRLGQVGELQPSDPFVG